MVVRPWRFAVVGGALLMAGACVEPPTSDGTTPSTGVGDPCSTDETIGDLCIDGIVCIEPTAGAGGACAQPPAGCDLTDFCACDLTSLCDGAPSLCFDVRGNRGVVCTQ